MLRTKITLILISATLLTGHLAIAQIGTGMENSLGLSEGNLRFGQGMKAIDPKKTFLVSSLLYDTAQEGILIFRNKKESPSVNINIDLLSEHVFVFSTNDISIPLESLTGCKIFHLESVINFEVIVIAGKYYMAEILIDDKYKIAKIVRATIRKPTYNRALDQGSKEPKVIRNVKYCLIDNDAIISLPNKSKKINKDLVSDRQLINFSKMKKSSLKTDQEVTDFFTDFFNSIKK